jgi:hypothetical protein
MGIVFLGLKSLEDLPAAISVRSFSTTQRSVFVYQDPICDAGRDNFGIARDSFTSGVFLQPSCGGRNLPLAVALASQDSGKLALPILREQCPHTNGGGDRHQYLRAGSLHLFPSANTMNNFSILASSVSAAHAPRRQQHKIVSAKVLFSSCGQFVDKIFSIHRINHL